MSLATREAPELRQELLRRELARREVVDFGEYLLPWWRAEQHHELVAQALMRVARYVETQGAEGCGRLMILMPPRHGKTELASRIFPSWLLGKLPDSRIILTSYGADLAVENSRKVREYVTMQRYWSVFGDRSAVNTPVALSSDSRAAQAWELAAPHRGGLVAAGVGGGITGKGAHLLVIDDPFKNRDEAESESHRERVYDWYKSSAYTRLEKGGAVVVFHTRWHPDDLAGKLLKKMAEGGDQWEVILLPAIWERPVLPEGMTFKEFQAQKLAEGVWVEWRDTLGRKAGEALWPAKYDVRALETFRVNAGEYDWAALYQQTPYLRSGDFFRREWFTIVDNGPAMVRRVRYWDKAGSRKGDYTAGVLIGFGVDGNYYIEHVARGRWTPMEREAQMLRIAQADARRTGPYTATWHQQDPGSAGLDSAQATNRKLAEAGFGARFEPLTGDKEVRAGPLSSALQGGQVRLVRGGWNQAFVEECVSFPAGNYDDQVDAAASAFNKLAKSGKSIWI